jgi:hypothetical protein
LLRAISWPQKEPQYQPEQREQYYDDDPKQLFAIVRGALQDIDQRPDVADKNQYAKDPAISKVEHLEFSSSVLRSPYTQLSPSIAQAGHGRDRRLPLPGMTELLPLEKAAGAYERMMSNKARFPVAITTGN